MSYRLILIVILLIIIVINTIVKPKENFTDVEVESNSVDPNVLDKVNLMEDKIDDLADKEIETRTFCKLLRHDDSNKEQIKTMIQNRNKQFGDNWKKQNKMISQIKKKIIEVKLGKNNEVFMKFNTGRNKKQQEYEKRKKIIEVAEKMIKKPPTLNLTFENNL